MKAKTGLYANINAKRKRIEGGSGERMRKPGSKGAPTDEAFAKSAKTAKGYHRMPDGRVMKNSAHKKRGK